MKAIEVRIVVDASVILETCLAGGARGPLDGHTLDAPAHLPAEVTSALRELVWRGDVPTDRGREALRHLTGLTVTYAGPVSLSEAAWMVAEELGWAKTYDAAYVALARRLAVPLITVDARLQRGAGHLVKVWSPQDLASASG